ncbi:MAG: CinA family nicotinamide mononucleotide deamidase-related protein [Caldilineaceae bacterium]|nr:CinA family nicotinamide mononucleotide deamidase-related protein [Caldilineaceae bacterium]
MTLSAWLKGEIVTTGTEILLGETVDTNASWIAQQLNAVGINLYYKSTVGDNIGRVTEVLQRCISRSDVVIVTGGLGPTADDITRDAVALAVEDELVLDQATVEALQARFSNWGTRMTANNQQQALIPATATIVPNPVGTAPGFRVSSGDCTIFALPGVPREMKRMMTDSVLPWLSQRTGGTGVIHVRTLRTIGIGESAIDNEIRDLMAGENPTVGLAAHTGQADVRLTARGRDANEADRLLDQMEEQVRSRLGDHIYSDVKGLDIARHIVELLETHDRTLASFELNTQGRIAERLRSQEGDSVLDKRSQGEELRSRVAALLPRADASEAEYEQALETIDLVLAAACPDSLRLTVLGTTGDDHGVYQNRKGHTWVLLGDRHGERRTRFSFGGTDELTAIWIGNRCFDLVRRWLLARA